MYNVSTSVLPLFHTTTGRLLISCPLPKEMPPTRSLLFDLPDDLSQTLYVEWLSVNDIGRLDSACTSRKHRKSFLRSIALEYLAFNSDVAQEQVFFSSLYIQWLRLRRVTVRTLRIAPQNFGKHYTCTIHALYMHYHHYRLSCIVGIRLLWCNQTLNKPKHITYTYTLYTHYTHTIHTIHTIHTANTLPYTH